MELGSGFGLTVQSREFTRDCQIGTLLLISMNRNEERNAEMPKKGVWWGATHFFTSSMYIRKILYRTAGL